MDMKKQAICDALRVWINQRPGLEPGNYVSHGGDTEGRKAYFSESRRIQRQRRDALTLLRAVELRDSISGDELLTAFRAFSGRLTCTIEPRMAARDERSDENHFKVKLDYCAGQYWPTEYRAAAAAVLASALWDWMRDKCMPGDGPASRPTMEGMSAGDWLRQSFRREFGRTMQERYFN